MKRIFFTLLLIVATATTICAQSPVKWRATARMTTTDSGVITIKATITTGWHLYSTSIADGGPKPTTIDLSKSTGIKISGQLTPSKEPVEKMDKNFGIKLGYWEGSVTFSVPFKLDGPREKARVSADVSYMACDDNTCMPPKKIEISAQVLPIKKSSDK